MLATVQGSDCEATCRALEGGGVWGAMDGGAPESLACVVEGGAQFGESRPGRRVGGGGGAGTSATLQRPQSQAPTSCNRRPAAPPRHHPAGTKFSTTNVCQFRPDATGLMEAAEYQCVCVREAVRADAVWQPAWQCPCGTRPAVDAPEGRLCRTYDAARSIYSIGYASLLDDGSVQCLSPAAKTTGSADTDPSTAAAVLCVPCAAGAA